MSEWQPIETAPKEGGRILARHSGTQQIGVVVWAEPEWELVDMNGSKLGIGFYPSEWMDLPKE